MKTILYSFVLVLVLPALGFAQVTDYQVTDCQNNTTSIYAVLASGKPLLVASKGTDCSICMNRAAALQQWATNNSNIEVWAAMTKTYSNNNPNCNEVAQWITQYNWTSIFTFVDTQKEWKDQGTPRYYVYNPKDSSLAYNGFDENAAKNMAQSLAQQLSLEDEKAALKQVELRYGKNSWQLVNLPVGNFVIEVVDLVGNVVKRELLSSASGALSFSTDLLKPSIYLIRIRNKKGATTVLKAVVN
jgi:hypothetical protein